MKGSGPTTSRLELWMAYEQLRQIRLNMSIATTGVDELDASDDFQLQEDLIPVESEFVQRIDTILAMMESKVNGFNVLSLTDEYMTHLNIWQRGSLTLKTDCQSLVTMTDDIGKTEHWSSEGLYRHLCLLQGLVPKVNEAAGRIWINPFFFRAAAMSPPGKDMVLSVEQDILAAVRPKGCIDYAVVMAPPSDTAQFLRHPTLQNLKQHKHTLFVSQAKSRDILSLDQHIPQAICEMYACAKQLGRTTIRGALTDGQNWIFFILKMNSDGNGAIYAESKQFPIISFTFENMKGEVSRDICSAISGIIAYWTEHSSEDIDENDWFTLKWRD
ncbi:hypothetical protein JOM56_002959 [Amanita muscaria]